MTIFGISILDFYGVSFLISFYTEITYIVGNIINYLTHTHFYNVLSDLFGSKVEIKQLTNILRMRTNNSSSTGSETSNESNSKINRWFNKEESEIIQEESETNNNKYYIIAELLIISCLVWYYYGDDIKPLPGLALKRFKSFRRRPDNIDGNNTLKHNNNHLSDNSWTNSLQNIWNKIKSKVRRNNDNDFDNRLWSFWDDFENKFSRFPKEEIKK